MSKCELVVEIDEPERVRRAGEDVTGRVVVRANADVECKAFVIEHIWQTHGRGNTTTEVIGARSEPGPRWSEGAESTYRFQFPVPPAPVTYHGALINVDHYVRARAEIAWALDPSAQCDFLVEAGPGSREAYVRAALERRSTTPNRGTALPKVLGWVLLAIFLPPLLALLLLLLPILLVVAAVRFLRRSWAERRLGKVHFEVGAESLLVRSGDLAARAGSFLGILRKLPGGSDDVFAVTAGDTVRVSARFTPRRDTEIDGVFVQLEGEEAATAGSGTSATTYRHSLSAERVELLGQRMLPGGLPVEISADLPIPDDTPPSFKATDNEIEWRVRVRIEIPRWPDWVHAEALLVTPREAAPAARG